MSRPLLLDLFCGAGGAAMGYHEAGFDIVGVDIKSQPNYPFVFIRGDALRGWWDGARHFIRYTDDTVADFTGGIWERVWNMGPFDAVHASPPCQRYIRGGNADKSKHPDLLGPTRVLLEASGLPWVIENVPGAPMRPDVQLCGSMFGLEVRRHRWFETSPQMSPLVPACDHSRPIAGVYGNAHGKGGAWPGMLPSDLATWSRAMGIDWMTAQEITDAIPPAYTEFIGAQLLEHLERVA